MDTSQVGGSGVLRTLLVSDLVDSTWLVERLGDREAAKVFTRHDRLARDLLERYDGTEIDKTDGFLLLFERPLQAVRYALDYHANLAELSEELFPPKEDAKAPRRELTARVGIHLGEVILRVNKDSDVARGAKRIEVEGIAKPVTARLMSVAQGRQTLLTQGAVDLARRAAVGRKSLGESIEWLSHGYFILKGVDEPLEIFEVGARGFAPLSPPRDSEKVRRLAGDTSKRSQIAELAATTARRRRRRWVALSVAAAIAVMTTLLYFFYPPFGPWAEERKDAVIQSESFQAARTWAVRQIARFRAGELEVPPSGTIGVAVRFEDERPGPGDATAVALAELVAFELADRPRLAAGVARELEADGETFFVAPESAEVSRLEARGTLRTVEGAEDLRVELVLRDLVSGKLERLGPVAGPTGELPRLAAAIAEEVTVDLGLEAPPAGSGEAPELVALATRSLYEQAEEKLRFLDYRGARQDLGKALELEGGHALLRAALADSLWLAGMESAAAHEAGEALAAVAGAEPRTRLRFLARKLAMERQLQRAAALYEVLLASGPGADIGPDLKRRAAEAALRAGRPERTLALIEELGDRAYGDPRLDLLEAEAAHLKGDDDRALAALHQAAEKASGPETAGDPRWLRARARALEGRILTDAGEAGAARAALTEAETLYAELGGACAQAGVLRDLAALPSDETESEDPDVWTRKALLERAVRLYVSCGNPRLEAATLVEVGRLLESQGQIEPSIEVARQALAAARGAGDLVTIVRTLFRLTDTLSLQGRFGEALRELEAAREALAAIPGSLLADERFLVAGRLSLRQGRLAEARQLLEGAQSAFEQHAAPRLQDLATLRLADVAYLEGDLPTAKRLYAEVSERCAATDGCARADLGRGKVLAAEGDLVAAEAAFESALAASGTLDDTAATELAFSRLLRQRGDDDGALEHARNALTLSRLRHAVLEEVRARTEIAAALVGRGETAAASDELDAAQGLLPGQEASTLYTAPILLTQAHRLLALDDVDAARQAFEEVLAATTRDGLRGWQLEASLALARLELQTGVAEAGSLRLDALAADAEAQGFGWIARRAREERQASEPIPSEPIPEPIP